MAVVQCASMARVAPKWPTPGTMTPRRVRHLSGESGTNTSASIAEGFLHRGEVAGAVVDECDHGRILRMRAFTTVLWSREHAGQSLVLRARDPKRPGERLEHRFNLVVARSPVHHVHVDVGACANREPLEEVVDELGLQVADHPRRHLEVHDRVRPAAEVDGRDGKRLVHRHDEVAGPVDAFSVAERLGHRLAERNAEVLDGMVLVDVEVAVDLGREIETTMAGEQLEHVVEKTDPGADLVSPRPSMVSASAILVSVVCRSITPRRTAPPRWRR